MLKKTIEQYVTITGKVIPVDKDKSGYVIQVAVETDDFIKYIIANDEVGQKLIELVNSKVNVVGYVVSQSPMGDLILVVSSFQVI